MFGKISVLEIWARKDQKMGIFAGLYLGNEKNYQKSVLIFRILSPFSTKNVPSRFPYLHPFTLKIGAENRYRKKSQNRFFNFLELHWSDFLHIAQSVRGPLGLTLAKIPCRLHFRFLIYVHFCKTDPKKVQKLDFSTPFWIFLKIGSNDFLGILDIVRG